MKNIYILLFLVSALTAVGQQEAQFTHFMYNMQLYNPAETGSRNTASFTGIHRSQWLGFDGAPSSQVLNFQTPLLNQRVGIGGTIARYTVGITNSFYAATAYSYNVRLTSYWSLRLGLQASLNYFGIDFADEKVVTVSQNDPSLGAYEFTDVYALNVGVGMFLTYKNLFYLGAASPKIYPNQIGLNDLVFKSAQVAPHRYFNVGATVPLTENLDLMPNVLLKWVNNAPFDADLNISLRYQQKVTAGLSYRLGGSDSGESVDALLFFQFSPKLGLGLAYDMTLSDVRDYQSGSVELLLRYDLKTERGNLENPRYFKKN